MEIGRRPTQGIPCRTRCRQQSSGFRPADGDCGDRGPGTGKSVLAIQIVAEAARHDIPVIHATGSKAFTTNMRGLVGERKHYLGALFKYFNNFGRVPRKSLDLVVCDEAHRLRETSSTRWKKSTKLQVDEIIEASKASVFFLDEYQAVRPDEVGNVTLISDRAKSLGAAVQCINLDVQFRCAGCEAYMRWLEGLLGFGPECPASIWRGEYDFTVCESTEEMEADLREKVTKGFSTRIVAGFCWPWSDPVKGQPLPEDVVIGPWRRPWNIKPPEMRGGSPPPASRHPYTKWANGLECFGQVGCIYSIQGLEFDYVGVIWGEDLIWDAGRGLTAQPNKNFDRVAKRGAKGNLDSFSRLLRQTCRVLLSRGMRGCRVVCLDDATGGWLKKLSQVE